MAISDHVKIPGIFEVGNFSWDLREIWERMEIHHQNKVEICKSATLQNCRLAGNINVVLKKEKKECFLRIILVETNNLNNLPPCDSSGTCTHKSRILHTTPGLLKPH